MRSLRRNAGFLTGATLIAGVVNLGYALILTWLLPVAEYAVFAALQTLLLMATTVAHASLPWLLAQAVASRPPHSEERTGAVSFVFVASAAQTFLTTLVLITVGHGFASTLVLAVVAVDALVIFAAVPVLGYFLGSDWIQSIARFRVIEVLVKVAVGLGLARLGAGAAGALFGFAAGGLVLVVLGARPVLREFRVALKPLLSRNLWGRCINLAAIQSGVAVLAGVDLILATLLWTGGRSDLASYQVAILFSRVPLFLAGSLAQTVFPRLTSRPSDASPIIAAAIEVMLLMLVPCMLIIATVPSPLVRTFFPAAYSNLNGLLPYTAASGALLGAISLFTTFFQAQERYRIALAALGAGMLDVAAVIAGLRLGGLVGMAIGSILGLSIVLAILLVAVALTWPLRWTLRRRVPMVWVIGLPLLFVRSTELLWLACAAVVFVVSSWMAFSENRSSGGAAAAGEGGMAVSGPRRLHVLHLAFEDYRRPGSGGGAVRTHEVNRRLAARHEVTVLTAKYAGCRSRIEDGVRYQHIGLNAGYIGSILTYFIAIPLALMRTPSDVVVEDFAAPFSSALVPLWTRRPVVGVAQWLFAREKSRQYHLPFFLMEELGVRLHTRIVAVSAELADRLRKMNGRAAIDVIPEGVDVPPAVLDVVKEPVILFLGRLEVAQKGLDLLIDVLAEVVAYRGDVRLLMAGDGRDEPAVRAMITKRGLDSHVRFAGRVTGQAKDACFATARIVCMPSRYETFGIVALEAMARGKPVVCFDIPCLREVVAPGGGVLVESFDVGQMASKVMDLLSDDEACRALGSAGLTHAGRYGWDAVASEQERVYLEVVGLEPSETGSALPGKLRVG